MSDYRLLVAWDVIEAVNSLPVAIRRRLKNVFIQLGRNPGYFSDYTESNERGITLDVHLSHGFAIKYWTDFADRHVKILALVRADI